MFSEKIRVGRTLVPRLKSFHLPLEMLSHAASRRGEDLLFAFYVIGPWIIQVQIIK